MARKVFFSFDFDDIMAVNVVRNSNVVYGVDQLLPFADHSLYEAAKNTPGAIKRAIDDAISGSSVTIILNGPMTWASYWVRYEIAKSFQKGNGFLVIDIAGVGPTPASLSGPNPLGFVGATAPDTPPETIHLFERDRGNWTEFAPLKTVSNATAKYPHSLISGSYRLEQRFSKHVNWKGLSLYFTSTIEAVAVEAGWQRAT